MKLLTVVGARPQFIKAAAISYAIADAQRTAPNLESILVNTGQHYDADMSKVFFDQLGIPTPDVDLAVGSGSHGAQTGRMLERIEAVLLEHRPDVVLVYGDTNSTIAGALAAAKLHIPVAHVEAGLRSFNRRMPEEVNRVLTDHISRWLFCPTPVSAENLSREGITAGVHVVGDVMYEPIMRTARDAPFPEVLSSLGVTRGDYVLATIHRAENTDDPNRIRAIVEALVALSREIPIIFPVHPRTTAMLKACGVPIPSSLHLVSPFGYREMAAAESSARIIVTDSGGVQKEAFWLGVPCVTVREETEWLETLEHGNNLLAGAETTRIVAACRRQLAAGFECPHVEYDMAGSSIVQRLLNEFGSP